MNTHIRYLTDQCTGILADAMGLGKTVCMIANIVNGRRMSTKANPQGPTLIVAQPSILIQWQDELKLHANPTLLGHVMRYSSKLARSFSDPITTLESQGIILTTYTEVAKSYPKFEPPLELTTIEEKAAWWDTHYKTSRGWLHRIDFHRVVLDEAQAIKNATSQCSIGCRGLTATHRWAISGTPVQNSLTEFYPYFKFLRVAFTGNSKIFRRNFCTTTDPRGTERLNILLSKFMIRRTHNDTLLGAKLLVLPKPSKRTMRCHFSEIEREIYTVVRTRFVLRINTLSKKGQLRQNYGNILVMLLRLRQLAGHPLLIQDTLKDLLEPEDFAKLKKICEKPVPEHSHDAAILHHLREMLRAPEKLANLEHVGSPDQMLDVETVVETEPVEQPVTEATLAQNVPTEMQAETDVTSEAIDLNKDQPGEPDVTPADPNTVYADPEQGLATRLAAANGYEEIDADPSKAASPNASTESTDPEMITEVAKKPGLGKSFGLKSNYGEFIADLQVESTFTQEEEPQVCCYCRKEPPVDPHITSCGHVYCYQCILIMTHRSTLR